MTLKTVIFNWFIALVVITMPFPGYSLNSKAIIGLAVYWMFYNSFSEKKKWITNFKNEFLIILIPFLLVIFGALFTDNPDGIIKEVQFILTFLIFPLIFFSTDLYQNTSQFLLRTFTYAVTGASLLAIFIATYFGLNNYGDLFFYEKFALILDDHTTYISLFVVISLLHIFHSLLNQSIHKIVGFGISIILLFTLYILSVRISLVALAVGGVILILQYLKSNVKWVIIALIPILLGSIYLTPNFQKRFEPSTIENETISDMDFRMLHWNAVLLTIHNNPILTGTGTAGTRDFLYEKYNEFKLKSAYETRYNAHNQFLEITLRYGIIGLFSFLCMILYLLVAFYKNKNHFALIVLSVFVVFFLTESILERHSGIALFPLLMTVFLREQDLKISFPQIVRYSVYLVFIFLLLLLYVVKQNTDSPQDIKHKFISNANKISYTEDFSLDEVRSFWKMELSDIDRHRIVNDPMDPNNKVLNVELRLEDYASGLRSELVIFTKDSIGYKTNYSFRFMFPESFFREGEDPGWYIIHQWHDLPDPGFNWNTQHKSTQPPIHLSVERDSENQYFLVFSNGLQTGGMDEIVKVKWEETLEPNRWYTFSCEVLWGVYNNRSYSIPKIDGRYMVNGHLPADSDIESHKIYRRNMYNSLPNYFKIGLYRSGTEKYIREIYFDDFKHESINTLLYNSN